MYNLGVLLKQRGELGEAECWYREAAAAGDSDAMNNLGMLLKQRGELGEAESWYRRALGAGRNSDAMTNLGALLYERGEMDEAETWWSLAARVGSREAMNNLRVLADTGDKAAADLLAQLSTNHG